MGEFSFGELILIVIIAILVYGKDLPQAARKLAQMYSKLRRQLTDIKDEIQRQIPADEIRESMKVDLPYDSASVDPPLPPDGLTATATGNQVLLTWNSSPGATTYNVKRSYGSADPFMLLAGGITDLSYTDSEVVEGTTYHYAVTAMNTAGESVESPEAVVTVGTPAAPAESASGPSDASPPAAEAPAATGASGGEPPRGAEGNGAPDPGEAASGEPRNGAEASAPAERKEEPTPP
jgi:Tat protein translocase TatB subunit